MRRVSAVASLIALPTLAALAALAACRASAPARLSLEDETAIRRVDAAFLAAANTGDVAKMASLYTADAVLLPPGMPPQVGAEAIASAFGAMMAQATPQLVVKATRVDGEGDLAYVVGEYRLTWTPKTAGAAPRPAEQGNYLEVLRRQSDGTWKMVADMNSPNLPPAPAARKQ